MVMTAVQTTPRRTKSFKRELMKKAKAEMGLTNVQGRKDEHGDEIAFYPYGACVVMFVTFREED